MRDSPRRVFLDSTTQDPNLGRSVSPGGSFDPGSSLWNLPFRVLNKFDCSHCSYSLCLAHHDETSSRARTPQGSSAGTPRGLRDRSYSPSWLSDATSSEAETA